MSKSCAPLKILSNVYAAAYFLIFWREYLWIAFSCPQWLQRNLLYHSSRHWLPKISVVSPSFLMLLMPCRRYLWVHVLWFCLIVGLLVTLCLLQLATRPGSPDSLQHLIEIARSSFNNNANYAASKDEKVIQARDKKVWIALLVFINFLAIYALSNTDKLLLNGGRFYLVVL